MWVDVWMVDAKACQPWLNYSSSFYGKQLYDFKYLIICKQLYLQVTFHKLNSLFIIIWLVGCFGFMAYQPL